MTGKGWEPGRILLAMILAPLPLPFLLGLYLGDFAYFLLLYVFAYAIGFSAMVLVGLPWHLLMRGLRHRSVWGYMIGGAIGGVIVWNLFFGGLSLSGFISAVSDLLTDQTGLSELSLALVSGILCATIFWWLVVSLWPFRKTLPQNI